MKIYDMAEAAKTPEAPVVVAFFDADDRTVVAPNSLGYDASRMANAY